MASQVKWADIRDDDYGADETVPAIEKIVGDIKTATTYEDGENGVPVKVITRSRVHRSTYRVSRTAMLRRAKMTDLLPKDRKGDEAAAGEEIYIEIPRSTRRVDEDADDGAAPSPEPVQLGLVGGMRRDHVKDKFSMIKKLDMGGDIERDLPRGDEIEENLLTKKYQAPRPTRGIGGDKDDCTVRVTNLSEETKEHDLMELFEKIGRVARVYLAKNKETKTSKGFAFVTYFRREDAEKAIKQLDRHGYDNLLLKVEWAKPSLKTRD